jgi:SPP1 gp7 family putative phage head morphogenesis protein
LVLINSTTQQRVIETLLEGQLNQENRRQLATRVRRVFTQMSRARAPVIALTESTRASATGTLQGLLQAGVPTKTWTSMKDNKVREAHAIMDGQTVAIGTPFQAPTGELAQGPGLFGVPALDAGCRCSVTTLETPADPAALAGLERRRAIHQRRVLAALRRALREQRAAVLAELAK